MDAYAPAAATAAGRPIFYLTRGTTAGLIAPVMPPSRVYVVVDTCHLRIEPATAARYLSQGRRIFVAVSELFGGPAVSPDLTIRAVPGGRQADAIAGG